MRIEGEDESENNHCLEIKPSINMDLFCGKVV